MLSDAPDGDRSHFSGMEDSPVLIARGVSCRRALRTEGPSEVRGADLTLHRGELLRLSGPEGCGKHLLVHLLGLLERPDAGEIEVLGEPTSTWSDARRGGFRSRYFGFVFPSPYLLPSFSVAENVAMPLFKIAGSNPKEAGEKTLRVLDRAGLVEFADSPAQALTIRDQHFVALARAVIAGPRFLFAEMPGTGLEPDDAAALGRTIREIALEDGITVVCSGGDFLAEGWRIAHMENGCPSTMPLGFSLQ